MTAIDDPSVVYIKAAQYYTNQKLKSLENKKFNYKAREDEGIPSEAVAWNNVTVEDGLNQASLTAEAGLNQASLTADAGLRLASLQSGTRVAIIGAGVAGLRTAMLLQKLNIPYKIFEANDGPGGRLFTYRFPSDATSPAGKHDYYEVGGMRFPNNAANQPTFDLFKELGFTFRSKNNPKGELIPFVYGLDDNVRLFNNITTTAKEDGSGVNLYDEAEPQGNVPKGFTDMQDVDSDGNVYRGVDACFFKAFNDLRAKLLADFDKEWPKLLKQWDWASTRSYLATADELKFPPSVVDWIEKHKSGTGRYSRAVVEEVLESITFDHPKSEKFDWWCIEGGSETLTNKMLSLLKDKPSYGSRVTGVQEVYTNVPAKRMRVSILDQSDQSFSHVVSTVSFAVLRTISTEGVKMNFNQREAMRALNYGQSIKVGVKFKTRWWENAKIARAAQAGGASRTDRQSRVVVYPSYGIGENGAGVLMVSYNWDQDAARFGALIKNTESRSDKPKPNRPRTQAEKVLLDQIYQDLAVLHCPHNNNPHDVEKFKQMLISETLDFHAFDWYHNPFTMGAFAQFTPGQFSTLYADILQPAGRYGNFHFAGELASHHHAWVSGALDSANRVVTHIGMDRSTFIEGQVSDLLPRSLVFENDEGLKKWHKWGLVEAA